MNVPCVICDLIVNIQRISNMIGCELLVYRFSEFLWLDFLGLRAYLPWGYLGKNESYEWECCSNTGLHSAWPACVAPRA